MAGRVCSAAWRRARLAVSARIFSSQAGATHRGWRNETPVGSSTEVFVYSPESNIRWPDPKLGVLGSADPAFALPGNIGAKPSLPKETVFPHAKQPDVLTSATNQETQVHALYNANDYIKYTPGSEEVVCAKPTLLAAFPALPSAEMLDVVASEAPLLLRKQMADLFPSQKITEGTLTVVTLSFKTTHDMSNWSEEMEEERERLTKDMVVTAKEICGRLKDEGFWADFIDPCSGTPHFSDHSSTTMMETDEKYRLLGFRIEDLGCCKVISHNRWGRHVFVGLCVTSAPPGSDVMENILEELTL